MENTFKQSKKVGIAGSFQNQMMGNNNSTPVAGEWFTRLHYTDRSVGKVISVSEDGLSCVIEDYSASADKSVVKGDLPMGHQCWKFEPTGYQKTIRWNEKKKCWGADIITVVFTKEFEKKMNDLGAGGCYGIWLRANDPELLEAIYGGHVMPQNIVQGVTRGKKSFNPSGSILFGVCDYYYDWSF